MVVTRSNRAVEGGRLLLAIMINNPDAQRDQSHEERAELNEIRPCNHVYHPLSLTNGGKRSVPPKNSGGPPAGVLVAPKTA